MNLAHDSQGFLTGDIINDIRRSVDLLNTIRADVAAIKNAVIAMNAGNSATPQPDQGPSPTPANPQVPRNTEQHHAEPRPRRERVAAETGAVRPERAQSEQTGLRPRRESAEPRARDASGRFSGGIRQQSQESVEPVSRRDSRGRFTSSNADSENQRQRTLINGLGDRISDAITGIDSGLEEVDPTVKAFNEVAEPLARGYQAFFGGDKDNGDVRWYRRILGEIKLFRREDTVFNRAARRSLDHIDDNTEESSNGNGGNSSVSSFLMGLLPLIMTVLGGIGAALLTGVTATLSGIGGILLTGVTTALGVIFSPIGAAIGLTAAAAWGLFTEDGRKFFADIGDRISESWDSAVNLFRETFPGITEAFTKAADNIAELWKPIGDFFKDKLGIVSNTVSKGVDVVKEGAEKATEYLKKSSPKTMEALNSAKEKASYGLDVVSDLASKAKAKITGKASDNKATLITEMKRAGITDPEEQAALLAQNDHESAGFSRLEENLNYSPGRLMEISKTARSKGIDAVRAAVAQGPAAVAELLYGSRKGLGNTEAGDGYKFRGRGFTQLTGRANYAEASKALGIDLVDNPDLAADPKVAAKIAVWFHQRDKKLVQASQSGDIKTARQRLNGGLNGIDDVVSKYGNYLAEANSGKFTTTAAPMAPIVAVNPAQSVFLPSPKIPKAPAPAAIAESPGVTMPLASDNDKRPITVNLPAQDVGQNLSDRTIAHIQLGGIGGV